MAAVPTGLLLAAAFLVGGSADAACGTAPLFASMPPTPEITATGTPER